MKLPHWLKALCPLFCVVGGTVAAAGVLSPGPWALLAPPGGASLTSAPGGVLHVTVHKAAASYYQIQLTHNIAAAVPAGATLTYTFSARSATKNPMYAVVEQSSAPYGKVVYNTVTLTPAWKQYTFSAKVPTSYAARALAARLQFGQKAGVLDFKSVSLSASK
jgi:hypothetical protein